MARASAICCSDGRKGGRETVFCVMTMVMLKGSQTSTKKIVHSGCYDIGKKGKERKMRQIDGK
jgi:ribosomal protein S7